MGESDSGMGIKAAFMTLGCKLNYAETSTYERGFLREGCEAVKWTEKADIYVINTCTVTATSDSKSRNLIRKMHRINPDALIVVTGCSAQTHRKEYESMEEVNLVIGRDEKHTLVGRTLGLAGIRCDHSTEAEDIFPAYSSGERTRSFLKVQDGCNNYCNYCLVPYARGESRNVPICECVRQAEEMAAAGIKEIVLTGVNTGDFGKTSGESFLDLLKALDKVEGIQRYRISSIEPNLISEETIDWIASGTKFLPHFHIPLQTGCDALLKSMGRKYDTEFFRRKLEYIRSKMETPASLKVFFGIDVMVGLPGETEEMFNETCRFIESIHPAFIHVFPYSKRPGTPAASMHGQVKEEEKKRRVEVLEEMCGRLNRRFVEENRGITAHVLLESKEKDGTMSGYTENYIRLSHKFDGKLAGEIIGMKI